MRNLITLIIIIISLSVFSCEKNTSPLREIPSEITLREITSSDDSHIADSIRSLYRTDAARLALNHVYKNKLPDTASVNIPQQLIESFYSGLIHIYNCKTITSIDTITKIWPIHTFPYVSLYYLLVCVDTSYNWTKQWENGFTFTGNDTIDSLLIEYELELESYSIYQMAILKAHKPLNMKTLGKIFEKISGVVYAESEGFGGSGNDLWASLKSSWIRYIFSIGWGDCPAGCIYRRFWEYTVSDAGEVRYWGSYGDKFSIKEGNIIYSEHNNLLNNTPCHSRGMLAAIVNSELFLKIINICMYLMFINVRKIKKIVNEDFPETYTSLTNCYYFLLNGHFSSNYFFQNLLLYPTRNIFESIIRTCELSYSKYCYKFKFKIF